MGLTPQHQRRCTSRLRTRSPAAGTGAVAPARVAADGGGSSAASGSTAVKGGIAEFAEPPSAANWCGDWSFASDYRPPGEERFRGGAVANPGGYSNSTNDSLINQTLTSNNMQAMYSWQDFLSAQLPMIWPPQADYQSSEVANNFKGVYPLSPTLSINPVNWYFVN
jgi:hypothetical protein